MANTMTIAQKYDVIATALENMGIVFEDGQTALDFIADRKEKSKKKSASKPKKVTDAQAYLRNEIIRILTESGKPMAVGEILPLIVSEGAPDGLKLSTSSVTANIGTMLRNGKTPNPDGVIVRSLDGKTAKFTMADDTAEEVGE